MLINLTKRPIRLHDTEGRAVEIAPDPRHVGLTSIGEHETVDDGNGHRFSVNVQRVRGVKGMPDPEENTIYVVPVEIAMAMQARRSDVVYVAEDARVRVGDGPPRRISHLRRLIPPRDP